MSNTFEEKAKAPGLKALDESKDTRAPKSELRDKSYDEGADKLQPEENKPKPVTFKGVKGGVRYKLPRDTEWREAVDGETVQGVREVSTESDASVTVVFGDGSDVRLGADGLLMIYGGSARQTNKVDAKKEKTQVLTKEGTVKGGLGALD